MRAGIISGNSNIMACDGIVGGRTRKFDPALVNVPSAHSSKSTRTSEAAIHGPPRSSELFAACPIRP